jgi:hypothetical protein
MPNIRSIRAFDAIKECIGSAVERGRPVHFTTGFGGEQGALSTSSASPTIASFMILQYVADNCAELGATLISAWSSPELVPIAKGIVEAAFTTKGGVYKEDMVRYISQNQWGFIIGDLGIIEREKVGANFLFGPMWAEAFIFGEAGNVAGALQVSGSPSIINTAFLIVCCDYVLIGEELYAASAYLSKEPIKIGVLLSQDIAKVTVALIWVIGLVLQLAGITWLYNVFNI